MKYIGNYIEWINPNWVKHVLEHQGTGRPGNGKKPDSEAELIEYAKARLAGYQDDAIYFWMFDKNHLTLTTPPFIQGNYHWWITKMLPGNFMPMHIDPHTLYQPNSKRFWMPLQDWQIGHIFMYKDTVITNYKAGDVWEYEDATAIHGAANIGHTPRIILQVSTHE